MFLSGLSPCAADENKTVTAAVRRTCDDGSVFITFFTRASGNWYDLNVAGVASSASTAALVSFQYLSSCSDRSLYLSSWALVSSLGKSGKVAGGQHGCETQGDCW